MSLWWCDWTLYWIKTEEDLTCRNWEYGVFGEKEDMSGKGKDLCKVYVTESVWSSGFMALNLVIQDSRNVKPRIEIVKAPRARTVLGFTCNDVTGFIEHTVYKLN